MQTTCKSNATNATNAQNLGGGLRPPPKKGGRRPSAAAHPFLGPSFVHVLHCFYILFACLHFCLHFIYICFAFDSQPASGLAFIV